MFAPTLSIVCPINNMANRLDNLEEWVKELEGSNVEIFLIHDYSDEKTGSQIREIVTKHPKANIIFSEGIFGSAASARNSVLGHCRGTWLAFWDSDDLPKPGRILPWLQSDADVVIGSYVEKNFSGESTFRENVSSIANLSFQPGIWRILFKRESVADIRFPEVKMGEDQDYLAQIPWKDIRVSFTNEIFYDYFTGNPFQTTAKTNSRNSLLTSIKYLSGLLSKNIGDEDFIRNLIARQSLTILKSSTLLVRLQTISAVLAACRNSSQIRKQSKSYVRLTMFLLKERRS